MRVQEARKKLWNDERAARKGAMSSFMERCTNLLEGSGISMSAYELASIWVACCILPPLVAAVIDASFEIVIICALLGVFAPPSIYGWRRRAIRSASRRCSVRPCR